jgi:gluconokinase
MILALDIGTSSVRAAGYDEGGRPLAHRLHRVACEPRITADGGVEHDARRLLSATVAAIDAVVHGRPAGEVEAVGITTFWHGLLGFDEGGRPVTPVYMWADTRSAHDARLLHDALDADALHARTGCPLHPSYWPAKLRWLARERPDESRRVARWGSFGEHLEHELFGHSATSISMASATGLLDQDHLSWDPEALAAAGLEPPQLFPLCDRDAARRGLLPHWAARWPSLRSAAWFPAVGDGAAGNVGSECLDPTRIGLNVGTSAALRVLTEAAPAAMRGLWRYRLDRRRSVVGGALSEGGNVYEWCRAHLHLPPDDEVYAALERRPPDAHRLTVLPFFAGERAPGWRGDRQAVIAGLRLSTTALDVLTAVLESVALRIALVYELLRRHAAREHVVVASGAAVAHSPAWARMIADATGHAVILSDEPEASSRGAALLALESLGRRPRPGTPGGRTIEPDAARHARFRAALERQTRLDERV